MQMQGEIKGDARTCVFHHVYAGGREDGHLAGVKRRFDGPRPVLLDHVRVGRAADGDDVVGGPRMEVRRKHRARAQVQHRHGHAIAACVGERGPVGIHNRSGHERVVGLLVEVEDGVVVRSEQLEPLQAGRSRHRFLD